MPGGGAHLVVELNVDRTRLRTALRILDDQLASLAAGHIAPGAGSQARWSLARELSVRYQTSTQLAGAVLDGLARGQPP